MEWRDLVDESLTDRRGLLTSAVHSKYVDVPVDGNSAKVFPSLLAASGILRVWFLFFDFPMHSEK